MMIILDHITHQQGNYLKYSIIANINKHITIDQPIIKHILLHNSSNFSSFIFLVDVLYLHTSFINFNNINFNNIDFNNNSII